MKRVAYLTIDVFTETRFAGNQLAVIPNARGLSDSEMQQIAAEFHYSETTFVLPPRDPANTAHVRIFTPTMEIPFAGHPNVGTAFVLGNQDEVFGKRQGEILRFEEEAGLVEAALMRSDSGSVEGAGILVPKPLSFGARVATETVAACASISAESIRLETHAPVIASVGLPFAIAELDGLDALAKACPNTAAFAQAGRTYSEPGDQFALFLYVRSSDNPWAVRARMFAPLDNIVEDPATGSASGALAALLVTLSPEPTTTVDIVVEQGVEMGRRSVIDLNVVKTDGTVRQVRVSGRCVAVMRGLIDVQSPAETDSKA